MMKRLQLDSDARRGLSQISLPLAFSVLLLAAPLAILLAMSFWTQDFLTLDRTFTLANFKEAWTSPVYRTLMLRSLKISIIVTVLTVGLAYPAAYYMSFVAPNNRKALLVFLITIPFWTSYLMRIFLWKVILGFNGVVNGSLMGLGIIDAPLDWISYNQFAVVITLSHAWLPFAVLPIFVVMEKVNRSYLEAAQDLGDTPFQRFLRITLPLSMPGVVAATLIVFIPTIGDYVTPRLVGGPDGLMIANMIEIQFKNANNAPLGAALALSALVLVSSVAGIYVWLNRRYLQSEGAA
ncbi:ABC transporter permease [Loktanella sp. D2R18]|uniref:ABC transporter permease n=1 Tax=Rhodobacterales TaxID=204455 RepID=UPI000DE9E9B1|nr:MULTISPECIES: ABC transporter permease [Rhodobacterales]MDO6589439.1 ABC transporter permease [Yoonia sp. 1_MG-2023]RBW45154.1 ABC transporter permease [Loktanella sp. D2R18]